MRRPLSAALLLATACATPASPRAPPVAPPLPIARASSPSPDPRPEVNERPLLVRGGTVMTADGAIFRPGFVLVVEGRIAAVGAGEGEAPADATVIDARGKVVTPGLIDAHSHAGVYPWPSAEAHADGNEMTAPTTPHVRAEEGFWPQDAGLSRALSGGVTILQVLPGSANLVGGHSFVAHLVPGTSARELRLPGAPTGLKIACGENPKRVYGGRNTQPMTRMGNAASFRAAFQRAAEYERLRLRYARDLTAWRERAALREQGALPPPPDKPDDPPEPPPRDEGLETLAGVLRGEVLVQNHCYRADDMHQMLDLAHEFGFRIRAFHHALEAYKLRDRLAAEEVAIATWVDWWGFKMEALDAVPQNVALLTDANVRAILHSDSPREVRRLHHEAAKARAAGRRIGLDFSDDQLLRWITANPAWALGIDDQAGTLAPGKLGDLVLWSGDPFSVYTRAEQVFVNGVKRYDLRAPVRSDVELGWPKDEVTP